MAPEAIGDDELLVSQGCDFSEIGAVGSEKGKKKLATLPFASSTVTPTFSVYGVTEGFVEGTQYFFVENKHNWSRTGEDGSNPTSIQGATVGTRQLSGIVYNDYMYLTNGVQFRRYKPSTGAQAVGLAAPVWSGVEADNVNESVGAGTGLSVVDNSYKWVVTFYNGVAESNFSNKMGHKFVNNNYQADLTNIPTGPSTTTERRIYRTDNNGAQFYRIGAILDNTTVTFTDLMGTPPEADPDAKEGDTPTDREGGDSRFIEDGDGGRFSRTHSGGSAGTEYKQEQINKGEIVQTNLGLYANWTDHDPPPAGVNGIHGIILNTDIVYGIHDNKKLIWSDIGQPEHWPIFNNLPIGRQTGETLLAIRGFGKDIICYTDLAIWRFRRQGRNASQSVLEQVDPTIGLAAHAAITNTEAAGHVFLGRDGIYSFDGRKTKNISRIIEDIFLDSTNADYLNPASAQYAVMASTRDVILLSYNTQATGFNNRTIRLDISTGKPKYAISQVGFSSLFRSSNGSLYGGDENDSFFAIDVSDGTQLVTWDVRTKLFPTRSRITEDAPEAVTIDADLAGVSTTVSIDTEEGQLATYTLATTGRQTHRKLLPMGGSHKRISVRLTSTGNATRKFYAVGFESDEAQVD